MFEHDKRPHGHADGASFMRQTAPGQLAHGRYKSALQRPPKQPLSHKSVAAAWSSGAASSAREIRRILTLPDGAANRRQ